MALEDIAVARSQAVYTLTIEVRRPRSGAFTVLSAKAIGEADVEHLVALQLAPTPLEDDVLSEFETAVFGALEAACARLVGMQQLLPIE